MNSLLLTLLLTDVITRASDWLSQLLNGLSGRWWLLDQLIALPLDNELVKSAVIGGCFLALWFKSSTVADTHRVRKILLMTLVASVFVMGTTKTLSKAVFLPRPYIHSQKLFYLEGEQLREAQRLAYRAPLDEENQKMWRDLRNGDVQSNDLGSFPSDHAGFYVTIAAGIWLASRSVGLFALAWTMLVILLGRVMTGLHSPLDIIAGSSIGVIILAVTHFVTQRRWFSQRLDRLSSWTLKYASLSSVLIFLVLYEIASTMTHARPLLKLGVQILKHLLGRGV